ncbi:MAG: gliding motility-associated ABC transporter permease subunit GldF [Saprospiraceae bacterium]|nr:gliding motility-associated ABC transporter permease subunit GldF [Saprospiraceae bacterium]MBK7524192.1 gliding motility-associated ABC transporter permease subunit GldF [Saprospiraceae bacterium]MBK8372889.1 gliding motility-associated ABC transporter permease subunit GldF [Saprospiraceae bacterium]MBK8820763.1 gliding motility-associated ABC transporter permease subunit GldF [Saprospiraceae bacterium]MBK8855605.1 gliding motility-associated ABC transporter permease subunit GldF [Saprospir
MISIFYKEVHAFLSSLIGYIVVAVFLISVGIFMWVFSDTSVLEYRFATMDQLFSIGPLVFLFLIPAITMRTFAEEKNKGTIEFLFTKPLKTSEIIIGKYLANVMLVAFSLIPTLVYYFSVYQLGSPKGNLDTGAIIGSYIGLFFLGASFVAIGMFASVITNNQIVAFIAGAFFCFFFHWAFMYVSKLPVFMSKLDLVIQKIGINYHYSSISKGIIDSRDILYFLSLIFIFLLLTYTQLERKK